MKPTLTKRRDVRGRRIVAYVATIGPISATASTPAEAIDQCETAVQSALDRLSHGTTIGTFHGHTYVISPDADGYRYWTDTFSSLEYSCNVAVDRHAAREAALYHLAQTVWTHDIDDHAFVADLPDRLQRDLLSYFQWQRDYRAFKAQGYDDTQIRALLFQGTRPTTLNSQEHTS
jgi:hypothetical protein